MLQYGGYLVVGEIDALLVEGVERADGLGDGDGVVAEDVGLLGEYRLDVGVQLDREHHDGDTHEEGSGIACNLCRDEGLSL